MRVEFSPINFGIKSDTKIRNYDYGKVICETGCFKNKKLDIYSAYSPKGELLHKLYYLQDAVGHWLKSKLVYFENGKKSKIVRSEAK